MAEQRHCPQCGAELPADTPQGLCPQCLMKLGLPTDAQADEAGLSKAPGSIPTSATPPPGFTPPEPAELATHFPQLEILGLVGHGGMGAVYKARQKHLDRLVALKILSPHIGHDPAFAERFAREARSLAKLNHTRIVSVYDFGQTKDGLFYFVMEFVDGTDLRRVIQAGQLSPREALAIVPQICEALQFAHDEGIVHRDIKPENILLDKKGQVKIADFGLAKLLDLPPTAYTLTHPQQRMGTPHYMAPEQIERPHDVDHRADIYSLGVVFYEMLTGELPIGRFAPPSKKVQVDVKLDHVVLRTLEKEPELRYQQASEVKTDVENLRADSGSAEPKAGLALKADASVPASNRMEKHVTLVAVINIVFGTLRLLIGMIAFAAIWGGGRISQDPTAMKITGIVATGVAIFFAVISVPELIGGIGLLKRRGWARILVLIISILNLLNIPIGTAIGIYTIWVLLKDETARLFAETSVARKSEQAIKENKGRGKPVLAIVAIVVVIAFAGLFSLAIVAAGVGYLLGIRPLRGVAVVSDTAVRAESPTGKIGQWDFPYGRPGYLTFGPEGPTLTDECTTILGLEPSQTMQVNSILRTAYTEYTELEARYTDAQQAAGSLAVIISPFQQEALAFLGRLWADLDSVLDEHQRALARRHLPLGRIFGTFQFGEPKVIIAILKTGDTFTYTTRYEWPEGSDRSGGGTSGSGSTLPPEYQRFWNQTATDEKHKQSSSIHTAVPFSNWNFPDNPSPATSPGRPLGVILKLAA
jgi:predicted Ser/Thr protein kinase